MKHMRKTFALLLTMALLLSAAPMAFAADDALTRGEAMELVWEAAARPQPETGALFTDVPADSAYRTAAVWGAENGIVVGVGDGQFGVNTPLTREQFLTMLYRYAIVRGADVSVGENTNILSYADAGEVSEYAIAAYQWACGAGVLDGITKLSPKASVTGAEAKAWLQNLLSLGVYVTGPISLKQQGMFSSGGTVTEPVEGTYDPSLSWMDPTLAGTTAHIDHANVFYQIPSNDNGNPIVYLHGYGQSRMGWMTTPDGREGWSDIFLRYGHAAFLVDQPRRGEAGAAASMTTDGLDVWSEESKDYKPGEQAWYTHFRIGLVAPDRYEGSQFPAGDEAQNQFFRQGTPNTGSYDQALIAEAMGEVLSDVKKMTGQKSIFITHSQGGAVGWDVDAENIAAIVAIEPGGTPVPGSEQYNKFLEAGVPIVVYFGDYIDNGPEDIMSTGFWQMMRDGALAFAEQYNADGGDATVVDLPKIGITGNSHFMFQELNNKEIADHIESWLAQRGLG